MIFGRPIMATIWMTVVMTMSWVTVAQMQNLLRNPSFEDRLRGTWKRAGKFSMQQYAEDKLHGQFSVSCTNRKGALEGPSQKLSQLTPGRGYELRVYVKLLNDDPNKVWQQYKAIIKFEFKGVVNGTKILPASGKGPSCEGTKGSQRKQCRAKRKQWKLENKQKREMMKKRKLERKKKKQQRMKEKKAKKNIKKKKDKKKEKDKQKKMKRKEKRKKKKDKEKTKKRKDKEKAKKKKKKEKEKKKGGTKQDQRVTGEKQQAGRTEADQTKPQDRDKAVSEARGASGEEQLSRDTEGRIPNPAHHAHLVMTPTSPTAVGRTSRHVLQRLHRGFPLERQQREKRQSGDESVMTSSESLMTSRRKEKRVIAPASGRKSESYSTGTYIIAWRGFVTSDQGWILLTGSINAPMLPFSDTTLFIRGPDAGIDFLMDNATFYEVPERSDWLADSHVMIDRHRKSDIDISVTVPPGVNPADIDVQIKLKNHLFGFGSKVEDFVLTSDAKPWYRSFRDIVFNLFNWATIGSFKWRFDKGLSLYSPDFSNAMGALEVLRQHGKKVRAHSIFWGVEKNVPEAVINTPPAELPRLIKFHTEYMMNLTKGRVEHWDVQNELLHGHWYEETLRDPHVSENMFKMARPLDPYPKLYLNDFTAVNSGASTEDYYDTALRFIKAGTGIQGLGIQGHVKEFTRPHPTMIWRRLDRLAETGLELFMTEFDLGWDDDVVRADWFEDAMRAYFAHPGLEGVIMWGFYREFQRYKNRYLVYGEDLKFAEQGQRYVCLVKKEWTTKETFNLGSGTSFSLRGFQGDYEVLVKRGGVPVQRELFTLGKEAAVWNLAVTDSTGPIQVQEEHDYVPQCISHRDQKSLGNMTSTFTDTRLSCTCHTSSNSGPTDGAEVSVTCPAGAVMTACSSVHEVGTSPSLRGERITVRDGVAECVAVNGPGSSRGVLAMARCCRASDLTCVYRQAGPSSPMDGAMAEAACPAGHTPLGCSAHNQHSVVNGAFPERNMTACLAESGPPSSSDPALKSGVTSWAACCSSPSLQCQLVRSEVRQLANGETVSVTCPASDVMTGCNAMAQNGGSAGARIRAASCGGQSVCDAYKGAGGPDGPRSVVAVAVCCHL